MISTKTTETVDQCATLQFERNDLDSKIRTKDRLLNQCPGAFERRKETYSTEFSTFIKSKEHELGMSVNENKSYIDRCSELDKSAKRVQAYRESLEKELNKLKIINYAAFEKGESDRRIFLDEDPQGGVKSVLGFRTTDDKILLSFFIVYGIVVFAGFMILFSVMTPDISNGKKLSYSLVSTGLFVILGWYAIFLYA